MAVIRHRDLTATRDPLRKPGPGARLGLHPLRDRLLAAYLFNEGPSSAFVLDATAQGLDATIDPASGQFSWVRSSQFRGPAAWALQSAATTNPTTVTLRKFGQFDPPWSVCLWLNNAGSDTFGTLCAESSTRGLWAHASGGGYKIDYEQSGTHDSTTVLTLNTPYMIGVAANSTQVRIYVNGVLDATLSVTTPSFAPNELLNDTSSETFIGTMDLCYAWTKRELTAAEMALLYARPFVLWEARRHRLRWTGSGLIAPVIVTPAQLHTQAPTPRLGLTVRTVAAVAAWRATPPQLQRSAVTVGAQAQWQAATPRVTMAVLVTPARLTTQAPAPAGTGNVTLTPTPAQAKYQAPAVHTGGTATLTPAGSQAKYQVTTARLSRVIMVTPARVQYQTTAPANTGASTFTPAGAQVKSQAPTALLGRTVRATAAQSKYQTPTGTARAGVVATQYARTKYQTPMATLTGAAQLVRVTNPARVKYQTNAAELATRFPVPPVQAKWQAPGAQALQDLSLHVPGLASPISIFSPLLQLPHDELLYYASTLDMDAISGDWLIEAPDLGLKLSFCYNPDGTWEHRIVALSAIEISVPPAGGMASVANVSVTVAEDQQGQSILELWNQINVFVHVRLSISFLLTGATTPVRVFTGHIDKIVVHDAVSEMLCVDDSVQRNVNLPRFLVTTQNYPNADVGTVNKAVPLIYGNGTLIGAAPLMLVDQGSAGFPTLTYALARQQVCATSTLAVFNPTVNRFMESSNAPVTLISTDPRNPQLVQLPYSPTERVYNPVSLTSSGLMIYASAQVCNGSYAIDGNSTTLALVHTDQLASNLDGEGYLLVGTSLTDTQRGNNQVQITLTNHRRSPGSNPTVTGTFIVRTLDQAGAVLRDNLFRSESFRHTLRPQTTTLQVPAVNVATGEALAVLAYARNEGGSGASTDTYEIGDIGITTYYQAQGDTNLFLGGSWTGLHDWTGSVTGVSNAYYHAPTDIVLQLLTQEVGLTPNPSAFAAANQFYSAVPYRFDGGIGAGWAVELAESRIILDEAARQGAAYLMPTFDGSWGLKPYREDAPTFAQFDVTNILMDAGTETQTEGHRTSPFRVELGNLDTVHSRYQLNFAYHTGMRRYAQTFIVDENGSNLSAFATSGVQSSLEALAASSFALYGTFLPPYVLDAYWLSDPTVSIKLLEHVIRYFSVQRITVTLETTMKALAVTCGDFITVTHPYLPTPDNGARYEVHTIRYLPTQGRMQLVASKPATLLASAALSALPPLPAGQVSIKAQAPAALLTQPSVGDPVLAYGPFVQGDPPAQALYNVAIDSVCHAVIGGAWFRAPAWVDGAEIRMGPTAGVINAATRTALYSNAFLGFIWNTDDGVPASAIAPVDVLRASGAAEIGSPSWAQFSVLSATNTVYGSRVFSVDNALYLGTQESAGGAAIYRFAGSAFSLVKAFSSAAGVQALTEYGGALYAGVDSTDIYASSVPAQVWKSTNGTTWAQVATFTGIRQISDLMPFSGALYAAGYTDANNSATGTDERLAVVMSSVDGSTWTVGQTFSQTSGASGIAGIRTTRFASQGTSALWLGMGTHDVSQAYNAVMWRYTSSVWASSINFNVAFSGDINPTVTLPVNAGSNTMLAFTGNDDLIDVSYLGVMVYKFLGSAWSAA